MSSVALFALTTTATTTNRMKRMHRHRRALAFYVLPLRRSKVERTTSIDDRERFTCLLLSGHDAKSALRALNRQ